MSVAETVAALAQVAWVTLTEAAVGWHLSAINAWFITSRSHPTGPTVDANRRVVRCAAVSATVAVGVTWAVRHLAPIAHPAGVARALMRGLVALTVSGAV